MFVLVPVSSMKISCLGWIVELPLSPLLTRRFDVFAVLFGGVQRFFLKLIP